MPNYYIVFHDDIDGMVSAALYLYYKDVHRYKLFPVSSVQRGSLQVMLENFKKNDPEAFIVILDFEYSELVDEFYDHHWNKVFGSEPVHNSKVHYDPRSKSAAALIAKSFGTSGLLIDSVNMIDACEYKNVTDIFEDDHPLILLNAYFDLNSDKEAMKRVVELMVKCELDMHEVAFLFDINKSILEQLKREAQNLSKYTTIVDNMSVIYQRRPGQFPRYSEYYLYPKVKYSVRLSKIDKSKHKVQVGYNQWCGSMNEINVGTILSMLPYMIRGGGHFNVGGGVIEEKDCDMLIDDLSRIFNEKKKEKGMEKYGVDMTNDPVELQAAEIIKTGAAKDMDEARKMVVELKKKGENVQTKEASVS